MAKTAMIPPMARLPVSPIKTWAGNELYHKNPIVAPTKALTKIVSSPVSGIYIMFR